MSPDVTLIENGTITDFTSHWQVEGVDVDMQVQEKVLQDVLKYYRANQLDETYRAFRKLIIKRPVFPRSEYRRLISSSQLRPLDNFLRQIYVDVVNFASEREKLLWILAKECAVDTKDMESVEAEENEESEDLDESVD